MGLREQFVQSPASALKWFSLALAIIYFHTGYGKVVTAGIEWVYPSSLMKLIQAEVVMFLGEPSAFAQMLFDYPLFTLASTVMTLVFELGFVVVLLLGWRITPVVLGLWGLHLMILLTMEIFFFDQYILFLLLVNWDALPPLRVLKRQLSLT
jgi:hypothetical protein